MKFKAVLALTAALTFGGALAQSSDAPMPVMPALTDVPAGHWAKDAVDLLVSKSVIVGFPDNTFRGNETLTRYQAALMLQRFLELVAGHNGPALTPEELDTIRNAVQELSSDLAALGVRVSDLEGKMLSKDDFSSLQDKVTGFDGNIKELSDRLDAVESGSMQEDLQAQINSLNDRLEAMGSAASTSPTMDDNHADMEQSMADLKAQIEELQGRLDAMEPNLGEAQSGLDEVKDSLASSQEMLDALSAQDQELQAAIDDLGANLDSVNETAGSALEKAEALEAQYSEFSGRVDDLEAKLGDLASEVENNTSSVAALNDLTVLLNQDILDLQDQVAAALARISDSDAANATKFSDLSADLEDLQGQLSSMNDDIDSRFDAVASDVDDLKAFNDVIRRDLDSSVGRVKVLEDKTTALENKTTALDKTVTDFKTAFDRDYGFSITGSMSFSYYASALSGRDFDIDRLIPGTRFSTGKTLDKDDKDNKSTAIDYSDFGGKIDYNINGADKIDAVSDLGGMGGFARGNKRFKVTLYTDKTMATVKSTRYVYADDYQPAEDGDGNVIEKIDETTVLGNRSVEGKGTVTLGFMVDFKNRGLTGKSADVNKLASATGAGLEVQNIIGEFGLDDVDFTGITVENNNADDPDKKTLPLNFYVKSVKTNFTVNGSPITLDFGRSPKVKFTDYVFDNDKTSRGPGILATMDGSNVSGLGSVQPKIMVAYGSKSGPNDDFAYFTAVRAEVTTGGLTAGLNAAREGGDGLSPKGKVYNLNNGETTVFGANLKGTNVFSTGFNLSSEYARSMNSKLGSDKFEEVFYARLSGTLGAFTLEDANYRNVSAGYNAKASLSEADPTNGGDTDTGSTTPFKANQTGFGVKGKVSYSGLTVGGYFDQKTDYKDATKANNDDVTKYGGSASLTLMDKLTVSGYLDHKEDKGLAAEAPNKADVMGAKATLGTFGGFSLSGFYDAVRIDNKTIDRDILKYLSDPGKTTGFGVELKHDGASADATVKDLNLKALYKQTDGNFSKNTVDVSGDYTLKAAGWAIKPSGAYVMVSDTDGTTDFDGVNAAVATDIYTRTKAGLEVTSPVLSAPLKPSIMAAVNYYNTDHTNAAHTNGKYKATELSYRLTLKLDEFLFPKSTFAASYANWMGENRSYTVWKDIDNPGEFVDGKVGKIDLSGYYLEWNYYDVNLAFGDFTLSNATETNRAQAFKIGYKVSF
ncbi:MAG: S-layer homology domain-containing protein [Deinococcaceae bacterium]